MYPDSWIYRGFTSCNFDLWWKQNGRQDSYLCKTTWLQVDFLCTEGFNSEILLRGFVMHRQIMINVNIFVAYVLNLPLNTERPNYRSNAQVNGTWFWLMTDAWYIALPLISWYHCLDPTSRDISRVHCISSISRWATLWPSTCCSGKLTRSTSSLLTSVRTQTSCRWEESSCSFTTETTTRVEQTVSSRSKDSGWD